MLSRRTVLRNGIGSALALTGIDHVALAHTQPPNLTPIGAGIAPSAAAPLRLAELTPGKKPVDPDQIGVERLAGLARLWGKVKILHPYLAYKDIDWDAALVEAIPRVRSAASPDAYRAALADMLQVLHDPATTLVDASAGTVPLQVSGNGAPAQPAHRVVEGIAIVNVMSAVRLMASPGEAGSLTYLEPQELGKARGVVFDCRGGGTSEDSLQIYIATYMRACVEGLTSRPVTLGTRRYREHVGLPPQAAFTLNTYRTELVVAAPAVWFGQRRNGDRPPLAFVIDAAALGLSPYLPMRQMLSGLQAAGLAMVVEESRSAGDDGSESTTTVELPDGLAAQVRAVEFVGARGETAVQPDVRIAAAPTATTDPALEAALNGFAGRASDRPAPRAADPLAVRGLLEKPDAETTFPDAEHRLLALFRFWNAVEHFFPYRDLMDADWAEALVEFIPVFESCRNELEYQEAVVALAARLQDSHVYVENADAAEEHRGEFGPPIGVRSVEGHTVITALPEAEAAKAFGLKVGDIIRAVDDKPIDELRAALAPLIAASTPQALRGGVDARLLRGPKDSVAKLRLEEANGAIRDVAVPRSVYEGVSGWPRRTVPATYEILPSGFGYVDLWRLPYRDADTAIDAMLGTPALIFDMRGYPNGTLMAIAPRLAASGRTFLGWLVRCRFVSGNDDAKGWVTYEETLSPTSKPRYRGKVAMLINQQAVSQAETACLAFAAATDVTFIGSPTKGADGAITNVALPGGLLVRFTGEELRYADGRQLQRIGVQPHIAIEPTIKGLREGRDEVLEAAVAYLRRTVGN